MAVSEFVSTAAAGSLLHHMLQYRTSLATVVAVAVAANSETAEWYSSYTFQCSKVNAQMGIPHWFQSNHNANKLLKVMESFGSQCTNIWCSWLPRVPLHVHYITAARPHCRRVLQSSASKLRVRVISHPNYYYYYYYIHRCTLKILCHVFTCLFKLLPQFLYHFKNNEPF